MQDPGRDRTEGARPRGAAAPGFDEPLFTQAKGVGELSGAGAAGAVAGMFSGGGTSADADGAGVFPMEEGERRWVCCRAMLVFPAATVERRRARTLPASLGQAVQDRHLEQEGQVLSQAEVLGEERSANDWHHVWGSFP
jgi:hypothetical protein